MKLLNAETMRKELLGRVRHVNIYGGSAAENLRTTAASVAHTETIKVASEKWAGSAGRDQLLNDRHNLLNKAREGKQENAATGYDPQTIRALTGLYVIDLVRQADDYADYTPVLFTEKFDENAPPMVDLRDYLNYVGKEEDVQGSGDTVPLMQHALPKDYPVHLKIRGFGDKTTLRELIWNPFHKTELVIESAARILADEKNKDSIGPIVGATYGTAFSQAKDTAGANYDTQVYNTFKAALNKLVRLINLPTGKEAGLLRYQVYLLINPIDLMNVQPVINGAMGSLGGITQRFAALPIDGIIPYGGGLNDGQPYGKETLSYPGVKRNECYLLIKVDSYSGYRIVKRNETMDIGAGDVLALSSEHRAWHRIRGIHNDWVLPKTEGGKNYGAVIKVELPTM